MWPFTKTRRQLELERRDRELAAMKQAVEILRRQNAELLNRYEQATSAYEELTRRMQQTLTPEFFMSVFKDDVELGDVDPGKLEKYTPDLAHGVYGSPDDDSYDPRTETKED